MIKKKWFPLWHFLLTKNSFQFTFRWSDKVSTEFWATSNCKTVSLSAEPLIRVDVNRNQRKIIIIIIIIIIVTIVTIIIIIIIITVKVIVIVIIIIIIKLGIRSKTPFVWYFLSTGSYRY